MPVEGHDPAVGRHRYGDSPQLSYGRQSGVRRDKPACCRGCKSPTGKENSDSILASSLAGDSVSCPLKRRPEVPVGRAIELRKADGSGCRLLSEMEEGNTAATSARVAVGPA